MGITPCRTAVLACLAAVVAAGCARPPGPEPEARPAPRREVAGLHKTPWHGDPAVFDERAFQPPRRVSADLEGDGRTDVVRGLPKRGGVQRLDARGRVVWSSPDVDVRQVEVVDADGEGALEIVHTNRQGAFVVRDAEGRVLRRFETGDPATRFALVAWPDPGGRPHIAQRVQGRLQLWSLEGRPVALVNAPVWNDRGVIAAAAFRPRGEARAWLALLDRFDDEGIAVLSLYDGRGRRRHDEVMEEGCGALAVERVDPAGPGRGGEALLVGCPAGTWRYAPGPSAERTAAPVEMESVRGFLVRGDAFGPLSFGDSPEAVQAARALLPGHRCRGSGCDLSYVRIEGRDYVLAPEFRAERLQRVALFALPEPRESYGDVTKQAWRALVRLVADREGPPDPGVRGFPRPREVAASEPDHGWRTLDTHRWTRGPRAVEVGVVTVDAEEPLQYGAYAIIEPAEGEPAQLPAAPAR